MAFNIAGNNATLISSIDGNTNPDKDVKALVRSISPDGTSKAEYTLVNNAVTTINGQPTTTQLDNTGDGPFTGSDAYRNGSPGSTDPDLLLPRTYGEEDDSIADMTLSTYDGTSDILNSYARFFLLSVSEGEQEKYQIVETFTSFYAFFYGKRPPVYRYSGILLNDPTHKWTNDFKFVYENYFRGTAATELGAEVLLTYDGKLITGFPLSISMQTDSMNPKGVPFTMDLLVIDHTPLYFSKDIASMIQVKASELQAMRDKANRALAKMNSNVPSVQANVVREVTNGLAPSNGVTPADTTPAYQPTSQSKLNAERIGNVPANTGDNGMTSRVSAQTQVSSSQTLQNLINGSTPGVGANGLTSSN